MNIKRKLGFLGDSSGKKQNKQTNKQTKIPNNAGDEKDPCFDPWVGKIPWRRAWKPIPVFLPGEFHG